MIEQYKSTYIEAKDGDKNEEEQTEDDDYLKGNDRLSLKSYEPPVQIQTAETHIDISERDI